MVATQDDPQDNGSGIDKLGVTGGATNLLIENSPDRAFDIVAIAASAGGLKALMAILSELPADFGAPIAVVQHISPKYPSFMAPILNRHTDLEVKPAENGELLIPGRVYIAPPNFHMQVKPDNTLELCQSEKVHFVRPAAEKLFYSAAQSYRERALGVVLTGADSDGAWGVAEMQSTGGKVIAQDRATSEIFGMPAAAINTGCVDWVLPLEQIATALKNLVATGSIEGRAS